MLTPQSSNPLSVMPGDGTASAVIPCNSHSFRMAGTRRHRGSVLILVVALLVLLAIIGTAFITSSGTDRDASVIHQYNVQIDLLVDGVKESAKGKLMEKITGQDAGAAFFRTSVPMPVSTIKPPTIVGTNADFVNVDFAPWDATLADRYPSLIPLGFALPPLPGGYPAATQRQWYQCISASPFAGTRDPAKPTLFPGQWRSPLVSSSSPASWDTRSGLIPTYVDVNDPTTNKKVKYPAFQIADPNDSSFGKVVLAADTDGDGIADAGLFELPVGQINGVKYFAAIRIIDNTAAINASTAWENMPAANLNPANAGNTDEQGATSSTPANIEFRALVNKTDFSGSPLPFDRFNTYRFGDQASASLMPYRDNKTQDTSFRFATRYDAFWFMLGARLDNPGYINANDKYRSLGVSESAALAYRGGLANPLGAQSAVERYFPNGCRNVVSPIDNKPSVNRQPYTPDQTPYWFQSIYDYDFLQSSPGGLDAQTPLRPLLVGHNPVSNFVPALRDRPMTELERAGRFRFRGAWVPDPTSNVAPATNNPYRIGDWVHYNGKAYICIGSHSGASLQAVLAKLNDTQPTAPLVPGTLRGDLVWAEAPWLSHPVKISVNTGSFGQLMAAYYAVMGDGPEQKPQDQDPTNWQFQDPEYGIVKANDEAIFTFGNVMRAQGTAYDKTRNRLSGRQIKQLRAAIAAVNTIDLRDPDLDITSRAVVLVDEDNAANPIVLTHVYGSEQQPYLTEGCINLSGVDGKPWLAFEIYNPSPVQIRLDAFRLARRDRTTGKMFPIGDPCRLWKDSAGTPVTTIPPFGRIYVESKLADRPKKVETLFVTNPKPDIDETFPSAPADVLKAVQLADLEQLVNPTGSDASPPGLPQDLILMRHRVSSGVVGYNNPVANLANAFDEFDDSAATAPGAGEVASDKLKDLIPVDLLEISGVIPGTNILPPMPDGATPFTSDRWHYRRATARGSNDLWHCVYGGPYNRNAPPGTPPERRQRGWVKDPRPDPTAGGPTTMPPTKYIERVTLPGFLADKTRGVTVPHNNGTYLPTAATYRTRLMQIASYGMPGPWRADSTANPPVTPRFPFGGFARAGDIMAVPYVGGYRIDLLASNTQEINAVSMDAAFAEDGDNRDDDVGGIPLEQLGRFSPLMSPGYDDITLPSPTSALAPNPSHHYAWATDLFDYLTTYSPQSDQLPNVDPSQSPKTVGGDPTVPGSIAKWYNVSAAPAISVAAPQAVPNGLAVTTVATANLNGAEDTAGTHGLINLNTAPWKIIAQVPFTPDRDANEDIARSVVTYRDQNGPYRNLFDLLKVKVKAGKRITTDTDFGDILNTGVFAGLTKLQKGDITPIPVSPPDHDRDDHVTGDFESKYMMLTRISNMVTFRSDSFTVYVLVQGWRGAGTSSPELVVQRRAAMLVDRTSVKPVINTGGQEVTPMSITNVPNN